MDRINIGRGYPRSRRSGGGAFDSGSPPPAPPFASLDLRSVTAHGKPSTAAGLSKPRLAKVRKQFASLRVRPAVIADAEDGSGFNPFRSSVPLDASSRNEGGGLHELQEGLFSQKQFDPKGGAKVTGNTKFGGFEHPPHELDNRAFVFGSGVQTNSSIGQTMREHSMNLECTSYESEPTERRSGNTVVGNDGSGLAADVGGFVPGDGLKEDGNLGQSSTDTFGFNLNNFAGSSEFVFGSGSSNLNRENKPGDVDATEFVSGVKKNASPHWNLPVGSSDNDFDGSEFGKTKNAPYASNLTNGIKSIRPDKILDNASAFSNRISTDSHSSGWSKMDTMSWNNPENPSVPNSENSVIFAASSVGNSDLKSSSMNTVGPTGNFTDERSGISDEYTFLFGSGVRISNASEKSFNGYDKHSFLNLYDKMGKLNLQTSSDADACEKKGIYNVRNSSVFGFNRTSPSSLAGSAANALSEELSKVSIGSEISSQNIRNGSMENPEDSYIFGSNIKKRSTLGQMSVISEKSFPSEILNEIQKLNIRDSRDDCSSSESKNADSQFQVHNFIFAEDSKLSDASEGGATLHEDIQKLNIRSETENSDGNVDKGRGMIPNASPSKFTYKANEHEKDSNINDIPSSEAHGDFRLGAEPPFFVSSFGHDSRFIETGFNFTGKCEEVGMTHMESRSAKSTNELPKESLFAGPRQPIPLSGKKGEAKGSRMKKKGGRLKHSNPMHQTFAQTFVSVEKVFESKDPESPHGYSPMDYSPYQENLVADQSSREASVPLDKSDHTASPIASTNIEKPILIDVSEDLISATQHLDINKDDSTHGEPDHNDSSDHNNREFDVRSSDNAEICTPEIEKFVSKSENVDLPCGSAAMETEAELFGGTVHATQATETGKSFAFASSSESYGGSKFTFGASFFGQGPFSAMKCQNRRKSREKVGKDTFTPVSDASVSSIVNMYPIPSSTVQPDLARGIKTMQSGPQLVENTIARIDMKLDAKKDPTITDSERVAEHEACEKWRLRGNQAYAYGLLLKAEDYYTHGINSISQKEKSQSYNRALMLCYSNRAAARLSLGRIREALGDCKLAVAIDSQFLRAQVRAANCHLLLGEIAEAMKHFNKCLLSQHDGSLDQKILVEANNGLQKAQKVAEYMVQAKELLLTRRFNEVMKALQMISDSLLISTHSETLMEMKSEALLMLRRYEDAIKFCEQTIEDAERNATTSIMSSNIDRSEVIQDFPVRPWRWHIISKANFYLGRLEEALDVLKKHDQVETIIDKNKKECSGSSTSLFVIICELLRLKNAGNEAFKEGRHMDAIKHYSAAVAFNNESRPFSAICLCNRAAAYQALGQITDAIADCSLAIALDSSYAKALSRRAALHERIRDFGQASNDLRRLISLLEKQNKDSDNRDGTLERSINTSSDLCQARLRLSVVEEARKDIPLDMHLILGIEPSSSAADVKKAYRKAALRHHPDKVLYPIICDNIHFKIFIVTCWCRLVCSSLGVRILKMAFGERLLKKFIWMLIDCSR
ncbi:hypothetical protein Cni_G22450 [Canna indica]|uniref:J domain-containing protein n=1 Tax=Canna indica TaxID=4628 RepID=A0AAQ3KRA7_9LILI|nr:hypothetical protein Cni_G22450 [Canna indica]